MESGKYYHIYNRGINKNKIFFEDDNYVYFLSRFNKYLNKYVKVLAYCLMPNHFHFFILVSDDESITSKRHGSISVLEKAFRDFFISYAKGINKRHTRTGALFQYKFKRKEITYTSHFTWLIYYIHKTLLRLVCAWPQVNTDTVLTMQ
ncbi:MAG: transposase [Bacteroidota bacterium]